MAQKTFKPDKGTSPDKIVVLSRSGAILGPIKEKIVAQGIKVSQAVEDELVGAKEYRKILSLLRLLGDEHDALAWRTLIEIEKNGLGEKCIDQLWTHASGKAMRLDIALKEVRENPAVLGAFGPKVNSYLEGIDTYLKELKTIADIPTLIEKVVSEGATDEKIRNQIKAQFEKLLEATGAEKIEQLISSIGTASDMIEQETSPDSVSVLTMHQAKGLTFEVCFIVGAEDEFMPGRNDGEFIGDERRLLYVSMTRAKHKLYISYCTKRTGNQRFYGRVPKGGQENRSLTRFLADAKIRIAKN